MLRLSAPMAARLHATQMGESEESAVAEQIEIRARPMRSRSWPRRDRACVQFIFLAPFLELGVGALPISALRPDHDRSSAWHAAPRSER